MIPYNQTRERITEKMLKEKPDRLIVVAKDGSGDFTSLQAARDAIPEGGRAPFIVLLRMDEYREKVVVHKSNVRIIGEARDRTVLTWNGCAKDLGPDGQEKGTFMSSTRRNASARP